MELTKHDIHYAVKYFARLYDKYETYENLLEDESLPKVVQSIIFEMFVNGFNYQDCCDSTFNEYKILLEYSKEYSKNKFKVLNQY